jgi:xylan 1,4-beta-xylosidase
LKLDRREHNLFGYYSADGVNWLPVGDQISAVNIDKAQPNWNNWVGTSIGLYAEAKNADFDLFLYKDGFSILPVAGYNNYFGVESINTTSGKVVTNTSDRGGWIMLGGIDLGKGSRVAKRVEVTASSVTGGKLEVWLDDLEGEGKRIATIQIGSTGSMDKYQKFSANFTGIVGQHDIFLRFPAKKQSFNVNTIQFIPGTK